MGPDHGPVNPLKHVPAVRYFGCAGRGDTTPLRLVVIEVVERFERTLRIGRERGARGGRELLEHGAGVLDHVHQVPQSFRADGDSHGSCSSKWP